MQKHLAPGLSNNINLSPQRLWPMKRPQVLQLNLVSYTVRGCMAPLMFMLATAAQWHGRINSPEQSLQAALSLNVNRKFTFDLRM